MEILYKRELCYDAIREKVDTMDILHVHSSSYGLNIKGRSAVGEEEFGRINRF